MHAIVCCVRRADCNVCSLYSCVQLYIMSGHLTSNSSPSLLIDVNTETLHSLSLFFTWHFTVLKCTVLHFILLPSHYAILHTTLYCTALYQTAIHWNITPPPSPINHYSLPLHSTPTPLSPLLSSTHSPFTPLLSSTHLPYHSLIPTPLPLPFSPLLPLSPLFSTSCPRRRKSQRQ